MDRQIDQAAPMIEVPFREGSTGSKLEPAIVAALKSVYDPEIPVNIFELGLIYALSIDEAAEMVHIDMTLTAPGCPVAGEMPDWVMDAVAKVEGIRKVEVKIVWDPPWTPDMMTEAARLELGMF